MGCHPQRNVETSQRGNHVGHICLLKEVEHFGIRSQGLTHRHPELTFRVVEQARNLGVKDRDAARPLRCEQLAGGHPADPGLVGQQRPQLMCLRAVSDSVQRAWVVVEQVETGRDRVQESRDGRPLLAIVEEPHCGLRWHLHAQRLDCEKVVCSDAVRIVAADQGFEVPAREFVPGHPGEVAMQDAQHTVPTPVEPLAEVLSLDFPRLWVCSTVSSQLPAPESPRQWRILTGVDTSTGH